MAQVAIGNDKTCLNRLRALEGEPSPQRWQGGVCRRLLHHHTEIVDGVGMHIISLQEVFYREFLRIGLKSEFGRDLFLHIHGQQVVLAPRAIM